MRPNLRALLWTLVLAYRLGGAGGSAARHDKCVQAAPASLGRAAREALCFGVATTGPAECAAQAKRVPGFSSNDTLVLQLCRGAASSLPAQCAGKFRAGSSTAAEVKVRLCQPLGTLLPNGEHESRVNHPAACAAALPKRTPADIVVSVCAGASSTHPAACTTQAASKAPKWPVESAAALCQGAPTDDGPASCAKAARGVQQALVVALCRGARTTAPAKCMDAVRGKLSVELKVELCRGASSSEPARCAAAVPATVPPELRVQLCAATAGAWNWTGLPTDQAATGNAPSPTAAPLPIPAACFKESRQPLRSNEAAQVRLCAGAGSVQPARCAAAAPFALDVELKVRLCHGSRTTAPARCVQALPSHVLSVGANAADTEEAVRLCQHAKNEGPALCFVSSPKELGVAKRRELCARAPSDGPAVCAREGHNHGKVSHVLEVAVCRGAHGAGPMQCVLQAPFGLDDERLAILCASGDARAATCAASPALHRAKLDAGQRAHLCARATSTAPAECAAALPPRLDPDQAVALCRDARDSTPAHCARWALHEHAYGAGAGSLDASSIAYCRTVVAEARHVHVRRMWWDTPNGETNLTAQVNFHLVVDVLDQFGQPRPNDSESVVWAWLPDQQPNGAALDGITHNTSANGTVWLDALRFTHGGHFDLHLSVGQLHVDTVRMRVAPARSEGLGPTGECAQLLYPWLTSGWSQSPAVTFAPQPLGVDRVATLQWPHSWAVAADGCAPVLEDAGLRVAQGWGGAMWVQYRPAMELLESGEQLSRMRAGDWWSRLQVPFGAPQRQVRKAYHQLSLLWHPDRWAAYPLYAGLAQDAFELVSEAYRRITEPTPAARGSDVGQDPSLQPTSPKPGEPKAAR